MNHLPHTTTLVIGDWSNDGHGKTELISIASNMSSEEVMDAYNKGSKKLRFNFIDDIAADYEDRLLPLKLLKTLVKHGLPLKQIFNSAYDLKEAKTALESEDAEGVSLWPESYTQIFLFIVKLGDPAFEYKIVDDEARINIGGYGLFE